MTPDPQVVEFAELHDMRAFHTSPPYRSTLYELYEVASHYGADNVVQLTGDCPWLDAERVTEVLEAHHANLNDFTGLLAPKGLEVRVIRREALAYAIELMKAHHEHGSTFFYCMPAKAIKSHLLPAAPIGGDPYAENVDFSVDNEAGLRFARAIYARVGLHASTTEVIECVSGAEMCALAADASSSQTPDRTTLVPCLRLVN